LENCNKCSSFKNYMYHTATTACNGNCLSWEEKAKELHKEFVFRMKPQPLQPPAPSSSDGCRSRESLCDSEGGGSSDSSSNSSSNTSSGLPDLLAEALEKVNKEDETAKEEETAKDAEPEKEEDDDELIVVKHPRGSFLVENNLPVRQLQETAAGPESRERSRSPRGKPKLPKLSKLLPTVDRHNPQPVEGAIEGPVDNPDSVAEKAPNMKVVEVMYKEMLDLKVESLTLKEFDPPEGDFQLKKLENDIDGMLGEVDCFPSGYRSVSDVFFEKFELNNPECLSDADVSALIDGNVSHFQN